MDTRTINASYEMGSGIWQSAMIVKETYYGYPACHVQSVDAYGKLRRKLWSNDMNEVTAVLVSKLQTRPDVVRTPLSTTVCHCHCHCQTM